MDKGSSSSSGKKIYFEEEAAPAKKGRVQRCQVEGCMVDLSDSKAYYCRHKVCGVHSKSPMVIVAGLEQRFCQQCSRFHQLPEFDQGKRSCRRRLAGHNERRRKPPPGPLLSSRYASLSPYTALGGKDPWPDPSKHRATTTTGNFQLPSPPNLLQGSTTRSSYAAAEDCFSGISDSTSALSLLSNESLDLGVNTWDFKADHYLHEISHSHPTNTPYGMDLGLPPPPDAPRHQLHPSSGYDSSTHHINWSL